VYAYKIVGIIICIWQKYLNKYKDHNRAKIEKIPKEQNIESDIFVKYMNYL
jgi:hypothetical protein